MAFELDFEGRVGLLKEEQAVSSHGPSLCHDTEAPKSVVCLGSSRWVGH